MSKRVKEKVLKKKNLGLRLPLPSCDYLNDVLSHAKWKYLCFKNSEAAQAKIIWLLYDNHLRKTKKFYRISGDQVLSLRLRVLRERVREVRGRGLRVYGGNARKSETGVIKKSFLRFLYTKLQILLYKNIISPTYETIVKATRVKAQNLIY